jgi:hypothetical protein
LRKGDSAPPPPRHPKFDAGYRTHNTNVYPQRPDRAYLGYIDGGMIILDISDVSTPRLVSRLDFGDAFANSLGMHTVIPLPRRKLAVVNTEAIAENQEEPMFLAGIVDIADEAKPRLISLFPTPQPPPGAPYSALVRGRSLVLALEVTDAGRTAGNLDALGAAAALLASYQPLSSA